MAPILVTGGLGLIGSRVVDQMVARHGGIAVAAPASARKPLSARAAYSVRRVDPPGFIDHLRRGGSRGSAVTLRCDEIGLPLSLADAYPVSLRCDTSS